MSMTRERVEEQVRKMIADEATTDRWQCVRVWHDRKGQVKRVLYDYDASPNRLVDRYGDEAETITINSCCPAERCEECDYSGDRWEVCNPDDCEICAANLESEVERVMSAIYRRS